MDGSVNGTASLITLGIVSTLHILLHCLNLTVVKSLQITSICNMMGVVGMVFQLQQQAFEKAIVGTQLSSAVHIVTQVLFSVSMPQKSCSLAHFCLL